MTYLFDTNIVLHYLRKSPIREFVEETYTPSDPRNIAIVSVVSVGEIRSIAIQNGWGEKRLLDLEQFLAEFLIADIHSEDVVRAYAEIDAFSQGRLPGRPLSVTARNMGKNDIWIAATASVLDATLITTDTDFRHLESGFIKLAEITV